MASFVLSLLAIAAPVPRHLFPPELDAVRPGFRWYFAGDVLEVVEVLDNDFVAFRCVTDPARVWTLSQCLDEARRYGRPPAEQ